MFIYELSYRFFSHSLAFVVVYVACSKPHHCVRFVLSIVVVVSALGIYFLGIDLAFMWHIYLFVVVVVVELIRLVERFSFSLSLFIRCSF